MPLQSPCCTKMLLSVFNGIFAKMLPGCTKKLKLFIFQPRKKLSFLCEIYLSLACKATNDLRKAH
eukprot:UN01449